MDINAEKASLIREIEQLNDISLLRVLKSMLHYGLKNEGSISLEQYSQELDEADAEIERGEFLTQEEALKEIRSWREQ
ncbi:MAG: hypothetical protein KF856_14105 [Cyclobacteriaceae bacterium]|nr:hypothetical protein [Cyclobacteriaceae bacterium]MBX2916398.1 hypothetical protein [Cyclobacteriaceae bacterium]